MKRTLLLKGRILVSCIMATTLVGTFTVLGHKALADKEAIDTAKEYMAPDLYLEFGDENPDWKSGIVYDTDKYVLDLVDKTEATGHLYYGGGEHKVEYRLRLKELDDKLVYAAKLEAYDELQEMIEDGFLSYLWEDSVEESSEISTETNVTDELEDVVQEELEDSVENDSDSYEKFQESETPGSEKTTAHYLELYREYQIHLEYLEELKIEEARVNEVGSVYFYRNIVIEAPVQYSNTSYTIDGEYDLLDGINYDEEEYSLKILNEEDFDISRPYTYVVEYELTKSNQSVWPFYRWVTVLEEGAESQGEDNGVSTISTTLDSGSNITKSGTYTRKVSSADSSATYITVDAQYVTVHLSGSGTLGGFKLSDNVEHFVIWIESGSYVNLTSGTTSLAAISGGAQSKVFILGPGRLTITGGQAGDGGTVSNPTSGAVIIAGGVGGTGAAAAIDSKLSVSVYSTNNNITIIGGSSGKGGQGNSSYYYAEAGTSQVAMAFSYAGGGGGSGGSFNYAIGTNAGNGNTGNSSGGSNTWRRNYVWGSGSSDTAAKVGGRGASGVLAGGGGGGGGMRPYYDLANSTSITSEKFYEQTLGGAGATLTAEAKSGEEGEGYDYLAYKYPGATILTAEWKNVTGASGGSGGTSYRVPGNVYGTVFPVVFHYSGTEYANPRGSTGALNGGSTAAGSAYVGTTGTGEDFYGFSGDIDDIQAGPTNQVEVIESTPEKLGVSFNPAPVIDLTFYFVDELGAAAVARWLPPDSEGRNTGYEIPEGYEITKYFVTAYNANYQYMDDFEYTPSEVDQYDDEGNHLGFCLMPEEDAMENVYYWSVYLEITSTTTGEKLLSPITVEHRQEATVQVERLDGSGTILMNLKFCLAYIKADTKRGETTKDGVAYYVIRYLDDYDHNDAQGTYADADREALENFDLGNTHITFETDLMTSSNTSLSNRYLLTASVFDLPKDSPDTASDNNISITFKNIRMTATTITTYGSNMIINPTNLLTLTTLQAVKPTDGIVSTSPNDAYIDIQEERNFTTLDLSNDIYAPELYLGSESGSAFTYTITNLSGANRVILKENTSLTIGSTIDIPYFANAHDMDKNGHVVLNNNTRLNLPGSSSINTIGNLDVLGSGTYLGFTSTFAPVSGVNVETVPAPLRITGDANISNLLTFDIDGSDYANDTWIGKDIVTFTSLDKIVLEDYYLVGIDLGIDEVTTSIEIKKVDDMRIRVTCPDTTSKEFASYRDAVEYIEYDYSSTVSSSSKPFYVTLITDYNRLALGGTGMDSIDNKAMREFTSVGIYMQFDSEINPETGEYYTFVDDGDGKGANDTFCFPDNPNTWFRITFQDFDFGIVNNIYCEGMIYLYIYGNVYANEPITYHGAYDRTISSNLSRIQFYVSSGLDKNGDIQGISLKYFYYSYYYYSVEMYFNDMVNADKYYMGINRERYGTFHYLQGNIYECGKITNSGTGLSSHFEHPEAIVHSRGSAMSGNAASYVETLYFANPEDAINRDLYVFFYASGLPAPTYGNSTYFTLASNVSSVTAITQTENIIHTQIGIAVIDPTTGDPDDLTDRVTYYGNLSNALSYIKSDNKTGEYEIKFIDDYQVSSTDNTNLAAFYRANVQLKFTSNDVEGIGYDVEGNRYNPETTVEEVTEQEEDEYAGYNKVKLQVLASTKASETSSTTIYVYQEFISLPNTYATPSYFDNIVFDVTNTSYTVVIRGGGGGVTMGTDVRATNGAMDVSGYSHSAATDYTRTGQNPYVRILGGEYRNVFGVREYNSTTYVSTTASVPSIYIEGGTIQNLYGGSYSVSYQKTTNIYLTGGKITSSIRVGDYGAGCGRLYVQTDYELPYTSNFDYMYLSAGVKVTMKGVIKSQGTTLNNTATYGYIYMYANSQLELFKITSSYSSATYNSIGRITTQGTGATLIVPKMQNGSDCLTFNHNATSAVTTTNGVLTVIPAEGSEYNPYAENSSTTRFQIGDNIFTYRYASASYNSQAYSAQAMNLYHFNADFHGLDLAGKEYYNSSISTSYSRWYGYVYLTAGGIIQDYVEHKDEESIVTESKKGMNITADFDLNEDPNTVVKTLHFISQTAGVELTSGYISNSSISDTDWVETENIPNGTTEILMTNGDELDEDSGSEVEQVSEEDAVADIAPYMYGQATLEIESYGINQTPYYAHIMDIGGEVTVLLLDVHSPIYTENPLIEQYEGDYHITIPIHDPTYQEEAGTDGIQYDYFTAGVSQIAWTVGDLEGCPAEDEILETKEMVVSENVKEVINIGSTGSTVYSKSLVISKEELDGLDLEETVIYVYVKDNLGSVRQIAIPLAEFIIDVSIPIRVGMIAVASEENLLIAPECFVVNNGNNTIRAEVIGTDIDGDNEITFVKEGADLGENRMCLFISAEDKPYSYMDSFSNFAVANLVSQELHIGDLSPAIDEENAAYFTFGANYNVNELDVTGNWNLFTMKYRFSVLTN